MNSFRAMGELITLPCPRKGAKTKNKQTKKTESKVMNETTTTAFNGLYSRELADLIRRDSREVYTPSEEYSLEYYAEAPEDSELPLAARPAWRADDDEASEADGIAGDYVPSWERGQA
jgi:hypothetical protein